MVVEIIAYGFMCMFIYITPAMPTCRASPSSYIVQCNSHVVIQILHTKWIQAYPGHHSAQMCSVDAKDTAMQIMTATAPHLAHREVADQCSPENPCPH